MSATPQDTQVPFTEWLHISPLNDGASPSSDFLTQPTIEHEGTPVHLNYIYPPQYFLASGNCKDSPFADRSNYPTFVSPFIFSSRTRVSSFDSNATLLATPSPKNTFSFTASVTVTPLSPTFNYTPFEAGYSFEDIWMSCNTDVSPIVRGGAKSGTYDALDNEENSPIRELPSFMDRLRAALPPDHSLIQPTSPSFDQSQPTSSIGAAAPSTPISASNAPETSSPLTPLTSPPPIELSSLPPSRRKRKFQEPSKPSPSLRSKKSRRATAATPKPKAEKTMIRTSSSPRSTGGPIYTRRIFPRSIQIDPTFALFYRRFPVSSYFRTEDSESPCSLFQVANPGGTYNPPREALDLYTPRFVKGKGVDKMGLCPICVESRERGGEDKRVWLAMKFSAFKCYHMQYAHGISASTGCPFSPPTAFQVVDRPGAGKKEKVRIQQGKCHKCLKWIAVEGIKDVEVKVKELFWWKHAAACHHDSTLPGERDPFEKDDVSKTLSELKII